MEVLRVSRSTGRLIVFSYVCRLFNALSNVCSLVSCMLLFNTFFVRLYVITPQITTLPAIATRKLKIIFGPKPNFFIFFLRSYCNMTLYYLHCRCFAHFCKYPVFSFIVLHSKQKPPCRHSASKEVLKKMPTHSAPMKNKQVRLPAFLQV